MFCVELLGCVAVEAGHLQFVDRESTVLNRVDNLAHLSVAVGLNHCESALTSSFKMLARVHIAVVADFEDAREDVDLGSNEEIVEDNRGNLLLFQEDAVLLSVVHFNGFEIGEVQDTVGSDNVSLLIVPFSLKGIFLFTESESSHNDSFFLII